MRRHFKATPSREPPGNGCRFRDLLSAFRQGGHHREDLVTGRLVAAILMFDEPTFKQRVQVARPRLLPALGISHRNAWAEFSDFRPVDRLSALGQIKDKLTLADLWSAFGVSEVLVDVLLPAICVKLLPNDFQLQP